MKAPVLLRGFGLGLLVFGLRLGAPAFAQAPIDLTPNVPPLRPDVAKLLGLHDGGARLVALTRAPDPALGWQEDLIFDYLTASDGTVYHLLPDRVFCWPPGVTGTENAYQTGGGLHLAGLVNDQLVGWNHRAYTGGRDLVEMRFSACGPEFTQLPQVRLREEGDLPDFFEPWTHRTSGELWMGAEGLCGVGTTGVGCRVGSDEAPVFQWWLTAEEIAERVPEGASFARYLLELSPELPQDRPITYALRDAQVLPDGRIAAILSASLPARNDLAVYVNWVVRLDPEQDVVEDLLEPAVEVRGGGFPYDNPLGSASTLHYDPEWDALWVGRVFRWQPSSLIYGFEDVGSVIDTVTAGRAGMGYRVIPLSGPHAGPKRNGYFDMTSAFFWLNPCENDRVEDCLPFARLGFGRVPGRGGGAWFKPSLNLAPRALVFDRDKVDLDADGLDRAAETALGTSDFDVDSDDDGAFDHLEVLVGRDPLRADAPPQAAADLRFVPSGVLAEAPHADYEDSRIGRSFAPDNPYCEVVANVGRCFDPAGRILVEWETDSAADVPVVSADGTYALFTTFDGVYQAHFDTGEVVKWMDAATVHTHIGEDITGGPDSGFAAYQHWVPIDRNLTFLGTAFDPFSMERKGRLPRYERIDGAPGAQLRFTTLFDTEFDFCDAGLVRCTSEPLDHIFEGTQEGAFNGLPYELSHWWTVPLGYHHELRRFLVGLGGHQQSLVLGFHVDPDEPPALVSRSRGLYPLERQGYLQDVPVDWCVPFPGTFSAVQPGVYQVGWDIWRGPALEPVSVGANPATAVESYACGLGATQPYVGRWGQTTAFGHEMSQRDLLLIEPLRVDPGDTLLLGAVSAFATGLLADTDPDGRMLYALGPWAGLRPVWDVPDPELVRGTGMGVSDDLRVCIADRPGQQVLERLPEAGTNRPVIPGRRVTGIDAIDCLWVGERLLVLTGAEVLEVDPSGGTTTLEAHGATVPVDLAPTEAGGYQVLDRGAPEAPAGLIQMQDGRIAPIAQDELRMGAIGSLGIDIDASQPTTVFHAVERPDGTVLVAHSSTLVDKDPYGVEVFGVQQGVMMIDGRGGVRVVADPLVTAHEDPPLGQFYFQVIAQVPGEGLDIWQGAKGPVCWFDPTLPECALDRPGPGTSPDGGVVDPGACADCVEDGEGEGCSCRASDRGPWAPIAGLAVLFVLRRRRRSAP